MTIVPRDAAAATLVAVLVFAFLFSRACMTGRETFKEPTGMGTPTPPDAPTVIETEAGRVDSAGLKDVPTNDITLKKNDITMVFAKRLAGAVWRMDWKGHLIIPELEGNGGSLQVALAFDIPLGESPEVENPTEAGNHHDRYGKTSSRWMRAAKSDSEVFTESQLAYYYPPGEKVPSSPKGTISRGSNVLSDVFMKKRVKIGWRYPNVVNFDIELRWTKEHWFSQVQVLAVYLARDFDKAYVAKAGKAVRRNTGDVSNILKSSPPDTAYPLIMAKSDSAAVGLYAHTIPKWGRFKPTWQPWYHGDTKSAGHKDFGKGLKEVPLSAVTAIWHAGDPANNGARIPKVNYFGMCLVFGSVAEVAATIHKLSQDLRKKK